ncbi:hypothetical protein [Streptomyces sp. RPT161]|uniref:hypothetical protein n=1 Tax=Streptomyces sp. RPT161 TaxID=3015993 RepID=UPI0022B8F18B|nr:hypothetical protein [Streptomyces sp. RPT161]
MIRTRTRPPASRTAGAVCAALLLGGASLVWAAGPAHAAESDFATQCVPPAISGLPPVNGTTKADITAPATAAVGDEVTVVWKTLQAASNNPGIIDLGKDTVQPSGNLTVGGAQTGTLAVQGPRSNPPIPKNSPMVLSDMTGKLKLTAPGDVTLTPADYDINVSQPISTDTKCKATATVPPAVTIKVTAGGGTSGGGTSGGTSSGGTSGSGGTGGTGGTSGSGGTTSGGTSGSGGTSSGGTTGGSGGGTSFTGKPVDVDYQCVTPIGNKSAVSPVQVNATKSGGDYGLTVHFGKSVMNSPADIPANSVKPSMKVTVGGADHGAVPVAGPTNPQPIKAGDPIAIPDLTGTYKPGATGKSTLTPGVLTVNALGTTTTCTPAKDPGVSLTLDTSGQPGGTSGGGTTGGTGGTSAGTGGTGDTSGAGSASGSGSSGSLAATGAGDIGALHALALVAGTVILLGCAVFAFTPWRRLRR